MLTRCCEPAKTRRSAAKYNRNASDRSSLVDLPTGSITIVKVLTIIMKPIQGVPHLFSYYSCWVRNNQTFIFIMCKSPSFLCFSLIILISKTIAPIRFKFGTHFHENGLLKVCFTPVRKVGQFLAEYSGFRFFKIR